MIFYQTQLNNQGVMGMGGRIVMKKLFQKIMAALLAVLVFGGVWALPSYGAAAAKCYTIQKGTTTVYKNKTLTKKYAVIQGNDEISKV